MAASTPIPVHWEIQPVRFGQQTIDVARLILTLDFAAVGPQTVSEECWLDSGAPLTVIPHQVHHGRLEWTPTGQKSKWFGHACDIGSIDVWLPAHVPSDIRGPISMLAKFARSDPPGPPPRILLGLHFVLTNRASIDIHPPPHGGEIRLP